MWSMCRVVLVVALLGVCDASPFSWTSCTAADSPITISSISIEPSQVTVPGDVAISVDAATSVPLSHTSLTLTIKRKTFLGEFAIPCLLNIGSCTYNDVCTLVGDMIEQNWAGVSAGIGNQVQAMLTRLGVNAATCPQPVQKLSIDHAVFSIGEIPTVLSFFAAGDYHIHVSATDTATAKEIICLDLQVTMHEKCSGIFCIIG